MSKPDVTQVPDFNIDDELEAYDDEHGTTDPEKDTGVLKESGTGEGDNTTDVLPGPIPTEGEMTVPPVTETTPIPDKGKGEGEIKDKDKDQEPARVFKTQEELDEYNELQRLKAKEELSEKKDEGGDEKPPEPTKFFDDVYNPETGRMEPWKPKDWNDFLAQVAANPKAAKALSDAMAPEIKTNLDNLSEKDQKELDEIDEQYDREYEKLASSKGLPEASTDEGKVLKRAIFNIGAKYLVPADTPGKARVMTTDEMYDMWASLPKDQGGGREVVAGKAKAAQRKQDSALLTPARKAQTTTPTRKQADYNKVHNTDMDSLIEEGLEENA